MSVIYNRKNPLEPNPKLYDFQMYGTRFLVGKKCALLADDMGLGKTIQAIYAANMVTGKMGNAYNERILVLCPAIARFNWKYEFDRFSAHLRDCVLVFDRKMETLKAIRAVNEPYVGAINPARHYHRWPHGKVVICSYDLADVVEQAMPNQQWDILILDESHYLKNPTAKRTKSIFGKGGVVHRCARIWALSGTPAPNNPAELWPLLYVFGVTKLSYSDFVRKYCNWYLGPRGDLRITGANQGSIPQVKFMLERIMLRRKKEDVLPQLPPIVFSDIVVPPGKVDLDIQKGFVEYVFPRNRVHELEERLAKEKFIVENAISVMGLRLRGLQMLQTISSSVSTLRRYVGLQKVESVCELVTLELLANKYKKIVLFAIHRDVIETLNRDLEKFWPLILYGGTPPEKRDSRINKFQTIPKYRVFIANILAAGTAISLTAADQILFVEQDWVPGNNAQAAARCHRMGQENTVFVRFAGLANSIDQKISQALKAKSRDLYEIFERTNTQQSESNKELDIFS